MTDQYWRYGERLFKESSKKTERQDDTSIMWHLLKDAVRCWASYSGPPRSGYPTKSPLAEMTKDDISFFQRLREALSAGTSLDDLAGDLPRITPSAEAHTHAETTDRLFHHHALKRKGNKPQLCNVLVCYAGGMPLRKIRAKFGMSGQQVNRAKKEAMEDMIRALKKKT